MCSSVQGDCCDILSVVVRGAQTVLDINVTSHQTGEDPVTSSASFDDVIAALRHVSQSTDFITAAVTPSDEQAIADDGTDIC